MMDQKIATPLAAIRTALPVLWHGEIDELEDVVELVMDINVRVEQQHRADVQGYVAGLWALAALDRGDVAVENSSQGIIRAETEAALERLRRAGAEEVSLAVRDQIASDGAWPI